MEVAGVRSGRVGMLTGGRPSRVRRCPLSWSLLSAGVLSA